MKKIETICSETEYRGKAAKVYRDSDYDEYVVRFYVDGQRLPAADYFTSDRADAQSTARAFVGGFVMQAIQRGIAAAQPQIESIRRLQGVTK